MTTLMMNDAESTDENITAPRLLTFLLGFCMFSTGASGLVNEYVLATMTTYILGNGIVQFSIVIASMMLMMGLSGLVQEKISNDNLILKFVGIEIAMAILGGFAPIAIYAAFGYAADYFMVIQYFFVLSIGFLIGFEIPIVMRIIDQYNIGIERNLKVVYAMDYIGAFTGALVWVFVLLQHFPLTEISFIVAGFNFTVAAITVVYFMTTKIVKTNGIVVTLLVITASALVFGYLNNREWNLSMEQKFYDDPIVSVQTTKYQHLVLTEHKKTGDVRLYINGNTQFSSLDENRYHDFLVHPAMALNPFATKVLVLGGGDGLALRELLKYKRIQSIDLVDLDPDMVKFASTNKFMRRLNLDSFADARVLVQESSGVTKVGVKGVYLEEGKLTPGLTPETEWVAQVDVFNVDADRFISETHGKRWDVIIIDFPDPSSVELAKLYSREFFKKLQWHMTQNAVVAIQSTSPYFAKEAYLTIGRTMEAAGLTTVPYHLNVPSFGEWGYYLAVNSGVSSNVLKNNISQIDEFQVKTEYITPEVMLASLAFGKGELDTSESCVNSLMMPCLLNLYEQGWVID